MNRTLSHKFRFFTFLCITLLVYVHGYNLNNAYLSPFTTMDERLTFTTFFEYLFANGLLRFRIPLLFLISGYIYSLYDTRPYSVQIKRRFKSLIIPYFAWSVFGLLLTFLLQQIPFTANIVSSAAVDQLGDNRPYTEIGWHGILPRLLWGDIAYQMWFILVLFVYNLIYPFIRWMVMRVPYIWLPLVGFLWYIHFNAGLAEGQGLLFFSLGVWIEKRNISIEKPPAWLSIGHAWIFFIGVCIVKTFMAFELDPAEMSTYFILLTLYQLSIPAGIVAIWFSADKLVQWSMNKKWFQRAAGYSFFLYGMHIPLLAYVMQAAVMYLDKIPEYRLLTYIFVPAMVALFCIAVGMLLKKTMPKVYAVVTGGRGF